jgi:hypothetical protein
VTAITRRCGLLLHNGPRFQRKVTAVPNGSAKSWGGTVRYLWTKVTFGDARLATLIVLVFGIIPGLSGVIKFYNGVYGWVSEQLANPTTLTSDEFDIMNEWTGVAGNNLSNAEAKALADNIKQLFNTKGATGKTLYQSWLETSLCLTGSEDERDREFIFIARSPYREGKFIVALDLCRGTSSEPSIITELALLRSNINKAKFSKPNLGAMKKFLVNSNVVCFSQTRFEKTYTKIELTDEQKKKGLAAPSCEEIDAL